MSNVIRCRGIRGATTVEADSREAIIAATIEMLNAIVEANDVEAEEIASAFFTTTPDLTAEFPALAARQIGWTSVALMGAQEMEVPGSLQRCLRVLVHVNTAKRADEIRHIYLRGAKALRPDLVAAAEATPAKTGAGR